MQKNEIFFSLKKVYVIIETREGEMMVRRVGLLINSDTHYTTELCKGAYEACLEYNIELIICYGERWIIKNKMNSIVRKCLLFL